MKLRPQRQVEVKRGSEIITCESCSRILYNTPEAKSAAQES
jgi:predicted  nucleic acid-binding Zn-ribbon protein